MSHGERKPSSLPVSIPISGAEPGSGQRAARRLIEQPVAEVMFNDNRTWEDHIYWKSKGDASAVVCSMEQVVEHNNRFLHVYVCFFSASLRFCDARLWQRTLNSSVNGSDVHLYVQDAPTAHPARSICKAGYI